MTTATTSNEICTDCGFPFDCPDGHGECNGQFIEQAQPPEAATPRPWVVDDDSGIYYVIAPEIALVATLDPSDDDAPAGANAALIVRAVNAHDGLVAALANLVEFLDKSGMSTTTIGGTDPFKYGGFEYSVVTDAREALKLARGE